MYIWTLVYHPMCTSVYKYIQLQCSALFSDLFLKNIFCHEYTLSCLLLFMRYGHTLLSSNLSFPGKTRELKHAGFVNLYTLHLKTKHVNGHIYYRDFVF